MGSFFSNQAHTNDVTSTTGLVHAGEVYVDRYPFCKFCTYIRFFFGFATVIGLYYIYFYAIFLFKLS